MLNKYIYIFILFLIPCLGLSQYTNSFHLSINNGLPNNAVRAIFKDSKGIIWIGTDGGLCKYNGRDVEVFTTKDGLSGNKIWAIEEDVNGILWLGCYDNGISYIENGKIEKLKLNDSINTHIRTLLYDRKNDCIYFGTQNGIIIKNKDDISYFNDESIDKVKDDIFVISLQEKDSSIYIYSYYHHPIYKYSPYNQNIQKVECHLDTLVKSISMSYVSKEKDTIYCCNRERVYLIDKDTLVEFKDVGHVFDIVDDEQDNIWLAAWDNSMEGRQGGLFKIQNDSLFDYTKKYNISSRFIWTFFEDTLENNLWIGTEDNGLYIHRETPFEYYDLRNGIKVNDLYFHNGLMWVASEKSLYSMSGSRGVKEYDLDYFRSRVNYYTSSRYISEHSYSTPILLRAWSLGIDKEEHLFLSSDCGFYRYKDNNFDVKGKVFDQFSFYNNKLYTAGWSHIHKLNSDSIYKIEIMNRIIGIAPENVHEIIKRDSVQFYLSWSSGLFMQNASIFSRISKDSLDPFIKAVSFDNKTNIIIAQNSGELIIGKIINNSLNISSRISRSNGLYGITIGWVEYIDSVGLFVGTEKGLNYLSYENYLNKNWDFQLYDDKEGYTAFLSDKSELDKENNIWLNTLNGIIKIKTKNFFTKIKYQNVEIIGVAVNNIDCDSLLFEDNLKLRYDQNSINFYFNRNNYSNADKDVYYYRISKINRDWVKNEGVNKVEFFLLAPGKYEFEVKCKNIHSGNYSNTARYTFEIMNPWYNTALFYGICIITIVFGMWALMYTRIRKVKREEKKEYFISKKISEMEMKALQAQMNPHFVFNTLNGIQNFVIQEETEKALDYIGVFSSLLRETLENASKKHITIREEYEFLQKYLSLELMRYDFLFKYSFNFDSDMNIDKMLIPPMLLQPVIENSLKHGEVQNQENGQICIRFSNHHNILQIEISDNGIGREKSSKKSNNIHNSKGLLILKERVSLVSDSINSGVAVIDLIQGTKVVISIDTQSTKRRAKPSRAL